jgi:hypothetical protein
VISYLYGQAQSSATRGNQMTDKIAEDQGIPLRTLEQVKADLARVSAYQADLGAGWIKLALRHGLLTEEARDYLEHQ